jgi:hypothetical protein
VNSTSYARAVSPSARAPQNRGNPVNQKQRTRLAREASAPMERTRALADAEVQKMQARLDALGPLPAPSRAQLP